MVCFLNTESHKERKNKDCTDIEKISYQTLGNGVYKIYPDCGQSVRAYCDMSTDRGGWTVGHVFFIIIVLILKMFF